MRPTDSAARPTEHWDYHFEYAGRQAGKAAEQERVMRQKIAEEEHVHLLSRYKTNCWNGDNSCMVWLAQGGQDAD